MISKISVDKNAICECGSVEAAYYILNVYIGQMPSFMFLKK